MLPPYADALRTFDCVWVHARISSTNFSMCTYARSRDFRISADIQRRGCYECHAVGYVLARLRLHGAALLDLGANIGMFTLAAAAGGHYATSFEPVAANAAMMRASIFQSGLGGRVRLVEACLGAEPGWARLGTDPRNQGAPSHPVLHRQHVARHWEPAGMVPVVALDSQPPLPLPVLLKIDIQGAECDAMRGGARWLEQATLVGVLMEWVDIDPKGPKRQCCAMLQRTLFERLAARHGLLPYASYGDAGPALNASRLCERGYGPRNWAHLVWDRPRADALGITDRKGKRSG